MGMSKDMRQSQLTGDVSKRLLAIDSFNAARRRQAVVQSERNVRAKLEPGSMGQTYRHASGVRSGYIAVNQRAKGQVVQSAPVFECKVTSADGTVRIIPAEEQVRTHSVKMSQRAGRSLGVQAGRDADLMFRKAQQDKPAAPRPAPIVARSY